MLEKSGKSSKRMLNACRGGVSRVVEEENHKRKLEDSSLVRQNAKRQKINRCINFDEESKRLRRMSIIEENTEKSSTVVEMMSCVEEITPEKPLPMEENKSKSIPCVFVVMPVVIAKDELPMKRSVEAITEKKVHRLEDRVVQEQIRNMIVNFRQLVLNDNTPKKDNHNHNIHNVQDLDVMQVISKYINITNDMNVQQLQIEWQNRRT